MKTTIKFASLIALVVVSYTKGAMKASAFIISSSPSNHHNHHTRNNGMIDIQTRLQVSSSNSSDDNHDDNDGDNYEPHLKTNNRRTLISSTTGILTSSILASTLSASAATEEGELKKRPPLTTIVNKIEKGLYFGPNIVKIKNQEKLYTPNTNGSPEKHLPNVKVNGNDIEISINHVMNDDHFIQFIWLRDVEKDEVVLVKACSINEGKPYLKARVPSGVTLSPCLFCNLHGFWKGEPFTVA